MDALVVGAGAQGRITIEILRALGRWDSIVVADDNPALAGTELTGARIIGPADAIPQAERRGYEAIVALGHPYVRLAIAERLKGLGYRFLTAVHPTAFIAPSAVLGEGTAVMPHAIVHTSTRVGAHAIINTSCLIEHDGELGDAVCISPRAVISGRVKIGRATFVAGAAMILPRLSIGAGSVIAAGALVTKDLPERSYALGVPARIKGTVGDDFQWQRLF